MPRAGVTPAAYVLPSDSRMLRDTPEEDSESDSCDELQRITGGPGMTTEEWLFRTELLEKHESLREKYGGAGSCPQPAIIIPGMKRRRAHYLSLTRVLRTPQGNNPW